MNHVEKLACYCFEKGFASGRGRGRGDSWTSTGTGIGYMNYLFGRTVKCVCRNRGHVDCYLFLNFEPHGYSTVVTEAVHVTTEAISFVSKPQCVVNKFSRGLVLLTHRRHRPFKMLGTGPLLGQALQNAWDIPC